MTASSSTSGGDFLDKKSGLNKSVGDLPKLKDVLIVDDESRDIKRLRATLHLLHGYDLKIRDASTLSAAIDEVMKGHPELVLLDDNLELSNDRANDSIPFLRRVGYEGPIVVISGVATRKRRLDLMAAGAAEVLHKDDVDSVRINEILPEILANVGFAATDGS
ncbi:MAG: response regulator [Alphaproteobacteria bacterium]|nr:response regulator [Alphaproteobacteria bacterium]